MTLSSFDGVAFMTTAAGLGACAAVTGRVAGDATAGWAGGVAFAVAAGVPAGRAAATAAAVALPFEPTIVHAPPVVGGVGPVGCHNRA